MDIVEIEDKIILIETILTKMAGVVRNRMREGLDFEAAYNHKTTQDWMNYAKRVGKEIREIKDSIPL